MKPISMPIKINTAHTVDCITSSGKTYCEIPNISNQTLGTIIIGSVIWVAILIYLVIKSADDECSPWTPVIYILTSFILLGLSFIFS